MIYHALPFALTILHYLIAIIQADESYNHVLEFRSQQTCLAMTVVTQLATSQYVTLAISRDHREPNL